MSEEKAFMSWRPGQFVINFPNGSSLSTIFHGGTYSDNYTESSLPDLTTQLSANYVEIGVRNLADRSKEEELLDLLLDHNTTDSIFGPHAKVPVAVWLEVVAILAGNPEPTENISSQQVQTGGIISEEGISHDLPTNHQ